ncbi:hypothetical protein [Kitasatospora sp. NPDC090091]|uniref:hypothetical protein n=1 Tax=Kitasatospora sp. NPDC090091 TaxID=3364081 RepID=UPI00380CBFC6
MLRRLSAAALAAAITGGALLAIVPAQSASAAGTITCNVNAMRDQAQRLRSQGHFAQANAIEARAQACEDAENNNRPWH